MSQLNLLDERLQNELARPAHWAERPSKIRSSPRRPVVDHRAWLAHVEGCEECVEAQSDLAVIRVRGLEVDVAVPCSVGIRLLPVDDLDRACGGIDRWQVRGITQRVLDQARKLDGRWSADKA